MKSKDLKPGVIYINKDKRHKGVIVPLGFQLEKPPGNIKSKQAVHVRKATGSSAGFLVVEASLDYPDELLLADALVVEHPVPGKVWPYVTEATTSYAYRSSGPRHEYGPSGIKGIEVVRFGKPYQHTSWPTVWMPNQFEGDYATHAQREAEQKAAIEAVRQEQAARLQRMNDATQSVIDRVKNLNLPEVTTNFLEVRNLRDAPGILVSRDVIEALLIKAGG